MFVTGYIGDPTFLKQTVEVAKSLKAVNPNLVYGKAINVINICPGLDVNLTSKSSNMRN